MVCIYGMVWSKRMCKEVRGKKKNVNPGQINVRVLNKYHIKIDV
jgi:hypothetical protein